MSALSKPELRALKLATSDPLRFGVRKKTLLGLEAKGLMTVRILRRVVSGVAGLPVVEEESWEISLTRAGKTALRAAATK